MLKVLLVVVSLLSLWMLLVRYVLVQDGHGAL
jgi:hypothetical protein